MKKTCFLEIERTVCVGVCKSKGSQNYNSYCWSAFLQAKVFNPVATLHFWIFPSECISPLQHFRNSRTKYENWTLKISSKYEEKTLNFKMVAGGHFFRSLLARFTVLIIIQTKRNHEEIKPNGSTENLSRGCIFRTHDPILTCLTSIPQPDL